MDVPWLVIGDVNEILYSFEKDGGNDRPTHFMQDFRDALEDCNLPDHGFTGDKFTWHRGLIRERLDRALKNEGWSLKFPNANLEHLKYYRSDHRSILMNVLKEEVHDTSGPIVLRFKARRLRDAKF